MVGGFESSEAKRLRNGTHDENIRKRVDVAELFAANEASKNHVLADAEIGG